MKKKKQHLLLLLLLCRYSISPKMCSLRAFTSIIIIIIIIIMASASTTATGLLEVAIRAIDPL